MNPVMPRTAKPDTYRSPKFSIALFSLGLLAASSFQTYAQKGFDVGLKGIVQTSSLLNTTDYAAGKELDYKNNINMGVGVAVGYSVNSHIGIELDVLSSKQGQGYKGDPSKITPGSGVFCDELAGLASANGISLTSDYTAETVIKCIKIPILFRYTGNNTKRVFFSSFIGPQIDLLSSAAYTINGKNASLAAFGKSATDMYNKTTFDVAFGFGAGINLTDNLVLSLHLRFDYGLGDLENKNATVVSAGSSTKFWENGRAATNNGTGGGLISIAYKFVKKDQPAKKSKAGAKGKHDEKEMSDDNENTDQNTKSQPGAKAKKEIKADR